MTKSFLITLVLPLALGLSITTALGDYLQDRAAALELMRENQHEQALAALLTMAEQPDYSVEQHSDSLELAVGCAQKLDQPERALELAKQVPIKPLAAILQMELLREQKRVEEALAQFGEADLDSWPDRYQGRASMVRGVLAYNSGQGKLALADFQRARRYLVTLPNRENTTGVLQNLIGDTYQHLLDDQERAIAAYRDAYGRTYSSKEISAAVKVADILIAQGRAKEASAELARWQVAEAGDYWGMRLLQARASAFAAAGEFAAATAAYRQILAMETLNDRQRETVQAALDKLPAER